MGPRAGADGPVQSAHTTSALFALRTPRRGALQLVAIMRAQVPRIYCRPGGRLESVLPRALPYQNRRTGARNVPLAHGRSVQPPERPPHLDLGQLHPFEAVHSVRRAADHA